MKGIQNIGNSCYLNSALQLLFNSDNFCKLLKGTELYNEMLNFHSKDTNIFNPRNIKSIVDRKTTIFRGSTQQDSSEFILFLFDIVSSEQLNNCFGIQTNISIKCKMMRCLQESSHIETNLLLFLPITSDLSDSYRQYKSNERLENDSAYQCDNCNEKTVGRKRTVTAKWSPNLIIVLKRFDNMMRKDERDILIPLEWRHGYKLKGGIIHRGSFNGGHYIYYGYNNTTNQWFIANDSSINIIDINNSITSQSYILYYEKNIN